MVEHLTFNEGVDGSSPSSLNSFNRLYHDRVKSSLFDCVKASGFNDRKASCIELILRALRSLNRESFHVSPNVKDFCGRALDIYKRAYDPLRPLLCFDESNKQQIEGINEKLPIRPGSIEKYDSEYKRNGVSNLFMIFEPLQGKRRVKVTDQNLTTPAFILLFFNNILANLPTEFDQFSVGSDNGFDLGGANLVLQGSDKFCIFSKRSFCFFDC